MRKLLILPLLLLPVLLHGATPKMPADKELKALVFDSLFAFNQAVQKKDFTEFHKERLASQFRQQFPLEKFTAAFQAFIDKGYDISNIAKAEPVFDSPPAIDRDGRLVAQGQYPTRPNKVTFKLTYLQEGSAWKLMGINVQAIPFVENTGKVPSDKELKALALDSLLSFNDAIQTKSFDKFYNRIAKLWQKEVTPDQLLQIFQSFIDKEVDLFPITKLTPTFSKAPTVNDDGLLVLQGSYPTQPSRLSFELKYFYEDESWKLAGINVQVKPTADSADKKDGKKKSGDDDDDDDDE
jgi:hypothetical protein